MGASQFSDFENVLVLDYWGTVLDRTIALESRYHLFFCVRSTMYRYLCTLILSPSTKCAGLGALLDPGRKTSGQMATLIDTMNYKCQLNYG